MERYQVVLARRARSQVVAIDSWWREQRPSAPRMFQEELAAALERLAIASGCGPVYRELGKAVVRRALLPRTRYHVYYRVDNAPRTVTILAVWHVARGHGPEL